MGLALSCFIMGFQNATTTRISNARIRITHATGMITDIGIALGRAACGQLHGGPVHADRAKPGILLRLLGAFPARGIIGAVGYGVAGFGFSLPLAAILPGIAALAR